MDLFDRKPAALGLEASKVIWTKMLKRPYTDGRQKFDQVFALRNQFNNMLDSVLSNSKTQHYVLSIKVDPEEFYPNGELTLAGQHILWKEIDTCLKKFNCEEINLKPKAVRRNSKDRNIISHRHTKHHRSHSPSTFTKKIKY